MTTRFSSRAAAFLGLAALALLPAAAHAAPTYAYTLTDLGTLNPDGGGISVGYGVNNLGQVTGSATDGGGSDQAFLSAPKGGALQNIGALTGAPESSGDSVNDNGQVAGVVIAGANSQAFIYQSQDNSVTGFGGMFSRGNSINTSGQIAGEFGGTNTHAFLTGANGSGLTDLGTLGGINSYGLGVNDSGQVTGYSYTMNGHQDAFLFTGGTLTDIGVLNSVSFSEGESVNSSGQVAGDFQDSSNGAQHAFVTGANGSGLTDLGTLGGNNSKGRSVNGSGQVVGNSEITPGGGAQHAFLYNKGGTILDLNTLIAPNPNFTLNYAYGISDNGYITGFGTSSSGNAHAFLLTPQAVPEASSVVSLGLLLAFGLGALAVKARRKA